MNADIEISEDEQRIQDVIESFDFQAVHDFMTDKDWTWYGEGVPTVPKLKLQANDLLRRVTYSSSDMLSTGGLEARKYDDGSLELKFNAVTTIR